MEEELTYFLNECLFALTKQHLCVLVFDGIPPGMKNLLLLKEKRKLFPF